MPKDLNRKVRKGDAKDAKKSTQLLAQLFFATFALRPSRSLRLKAFLSRSFVGQNCFVLLQKFHPFGKTQIRRGPLEIAIRFDGLDIQRPEEKQFAG